MLLNASKLIGCTVHASDGDIGKVTSLYFDCRRWRIRYFAVETGGWLNSRQVLLPSASFPPQNLANQTLTANLTKDQVQNSPDVDLNLAVSRTMEENLARHYNMPRYWDMEKPAGSREEDILYFPEEERIIPIDRQHIALIDEPSGTTAIAGRIPRARFLFSTEDLCGYDIKAVDGEIGEAEDFIVDDTDRSIRYLVADIDQLASGRKALLSPVWIDSLSETDEEIRIDQTKEAVRNSPPYDPSRPIEGAYERDLFESYNRETAASPYALWRFNYKRQAMANGKKLRVVVLAPALVRWTADNWKTQQDVRTHDTGMGIHIADLNTENIPAGHSVHFTFFWPQANHWENKNFSVRVRQGAAERERVPEMAGAK